MSAGTLTNTEQLILRAVNSKPHKWLNCAGVYTGEVLALVAKGLITTRYDGQQRQMQVESIYAKG